MPTTLLVGIGWVIWWALAVWAISWRLTDKVRNIDHDHDKE